MDSKFTILEPRPTVCASTAHISSSEPLEIVEGRSTAFMLTWLLEDSGASVLADSSISCSISSATDTERLSGSAPVAAACEPATPL